MISDECERENEPGHSWERCLLCYNYFFDKVYTSISEKVIRNCQKYLHPAVTEDNFNDYLNARDHFSSTKTRSLPLCKDCLGSAIKLTTLDDKQQLFQKSTIDFGYNFSSVVLQNRANMPAAMPKQGTVETKLNKSSELIGDNLNRNIEQSGPVNQDQFEIGEQQVEIESNDRGGLPCNQSGGDGLNMQAESVPNRITENRGVPATGSRLPIKKRGMTFVFNPVSYEARVPATMRSNVSPSRPSGSSQATLGGPNGSNSAGVSPTNSSSCQMLPSTGNNKSDNEDKVYKCSFCPRVFGYSSTVAQHERAHTGEKPYKCALCPVAFSQSGHLTVHKRTHTGEKPFNCTSCPMTFGQLGTLVAHTRLHSGNRPFKCSFCGLAFQQSCHLTRHIRIHTGEKPFKCSFCKKCFAHSETWKEHERMHTGEKPYECKFCKKRFVRRRDCRQHERIHTGEKPYKCPMCTQTFTYSFQTTRHVRRVHN